MGGGLFVAVGTVISTLFSSGLKCECQFLPNGAAGMSTMNISLPDTLKSFVDEQVNQRGYGTSSEYVRELIR